MPLGLVGRRLRLGAARVGGLPKEGRGPFDRPGASRGPRPSAVGGVRRRGAGRQLGSVDARKGKLSAAQLGEQLQRQNVQLA